MSEPRYVQHKSDKNGERFPLHKDCWNSMEHDSWEVTIEQPNGFKHFYYLPKSEYVLCAVPERWEDVTGEIKAGISLGNERLIALYHHDVNVLLFGDRYRVRRSPAHRSAFIVEKKL